MQIEQSVPEELLRTKANEEKAGEASLIGYAESTEDVSDFLKKANEKNKTVITIGSNTGLARSTYAEEDTWFLSIAKMNNIISLDEETLTLNVEAGVTLEQIHDYLADTPYFYAPDPGKKAATIAGTAGTNAGGMRAIQYGVTRDNIRGYEVVLANGNVIHAGSLNKKSSSGYDLKDLFIGSEGTLGVITELQLEIKPRPPYEKSMLIGFEKLDDLAPVVYEILTSPVQPVALELLEKSGLQYSENYLNQTIPNKKGEAFLLLTVNSNDEESVDRSLKELEKIANKAGALNSNILEGEDADTAWNIRDHVLTGIYAAATTKMYDPVVPTNNITELILKSKEYADELNIESAFFGHAGDGNIHICVLQEDYSDEEWEDLLGKSEAKIYKLIADLDGLPSAEHGIGLEKKEFMPHFFSEDYMEVLRSIKKALDPKGILNPGKIFDI